MLPSTSPLSLAPLPIRLAGLTGSHPSRRAGDGGDLHDVAPFAPGDRLRRIDWPVTARLNTGPTVTTLYVRRTFATADATVMLVVDSRDEVGPRVVDLERRDPAERARGRPRSTSPGSPPPRSPGTTSRSATGSAWTIWAGSAGRSRRRAGDRQLDRLVHRLALTQPEGEPMSRSRVPRLTVGRLDRAVLDLPRRRARSAGPGLAGRGSPGCRREHPAAPRARRAQSPRERRLPGGVDGARRPVGPAHLRPASSWSAWPTTDDPATARTALAILARQRPR